MPAIPARTLGRTGLEVTTLGYGGAELHPVDEATAEPIINAVLDGGVNFIDTSIDYGRSEEFLGRFASHRRAEFFLASKCGCVPGSPERAHEHTAANIRLGVERSLRVLRTDYLDLVQFHRSLTEAQFHEHGALEELVKMRDEGKVRFIGVSGTLPNIADQIAMGVFDVFQVPYSALQREHERVITAASEAGAGIIVRGGAARGTPSDWDERRYYMVPSETLRQRWDDAALDELLSDGMTRMEFTLRFTLSHPDLDTAIVGTKSVEHLHDNIAAAIKGPLPDDVLAEAKRRLSAAGAVPAEE